MRVAVLPLRGLLLDLLVRHLKSCEAVLEGKAQAIRRGQIAFPPARDPTRRPRVGVIRFNRGIEIAIRARGIGTQGQGRPAPSLLYARIAARCREALAEARHLAVRALVTVRVGNDLNDATEFAAELGRVARSHNIHRLDVLGLDFRSERGRAVIRDRDAVHYVLNAVLRTAGVQHAVGFEQPSGLLIHERDHGAAGHRGAAIPDFFCAGEVGRSGSRRIDQRIGIRHDDFGAERSHPQRDDDADRYRRRDIDIADPVAKPGRDSDRR